MKRIVFFVGTLRGGGAERVISILANKLAQKEAFDITILLYYDDVIFYHIDDNVRIVSVEKNTKSRNIIKNILYIRQFFKENVDILISFLARFNMLAIASSFGLKTPIIVADRNDPKRIPQKLFLRCLRNFLYIFTDYVVLQTEDNRDYFNYLKRCSVIYNPIDIELNSNTVNKEKIIIDVGRLVKQKNNELLINAFAEIHKQFNDYKLLIFGDGDHKKHIAELIHELSLDDCVFLKGSTNNILTEMSKSQIYVLPSNYEGMPNSLIEAMCLGLPVISTRVSGAKDLIVDNENGILIDVGDKNQLIDKLSYLINEKEKRKTLGENAKKIYERLNSDRIVTEWEEIIYNVLQEY